MAYVFDPEVLRSIVKSVLGQPLPVLVESLAAEIETRYPGRVFPRRDWVFSNAGGTMGHFTILHASLSEYIIVFGTPIGTEGHTGRFASEDFFYILEGEQWAYSEGEMSKRVYKPGDCHVLPRGHAEGWSMPDHAYAMEYARGVIPAMLPFGLADAITSTLDARTIGKTFRLYTHAVVRELIRGKV
jgi:C-8 sterol isomerase